MSWLCYDICKLLDVLVFSEQDDKLQTPFPASSLHWLTGNVRNPRTFRKKSRERCSRCCDVALFEGLDDVNRQLTNGQNFNWQLTNRLKSNLQLTFVVRFYWQLKKDRIALNTLKIRTVNLFCPYFVNNYCMDHPHQGHMSHIGYMIFDTQLDRQLMLVFNNILRFLL